MGERRPRVRRKLALVLPALLIVGVVGGFTLLTAGSADDPSVPGSVADPHPVAGSFVPDGTALDDCGDQRCYEQAFGNLVYEDGPEAAFEAFDAMIAEEGPVKAGCHRIAHIMGAAGLARYDGRVGEAFSQGSASCWSGYYHGILESSLSDVPRGQLGLVARELCDDVREGETTFLLYQCVHGLGHGLMITTGYELPAALDSCGALETYWDQASCRGGVFMENIATAQDSPIEVIGESRWLDDDNLLYPCNDDEVVPRDAKTECYVMATSRVLAANGYSFEGAARWCRRAQQRWIATCFQSLGRDSSGFSTYDAAETVRLCRTAVDHIDDCLWGAARDFTSNFAGGEEAAEMCMLAPARFRPGCFHGIGTIVAILHQGELERREACRELSDELADDCELGAQVRPTHVPVQ